jgi:hypothetical protein
MKMIASAPKSHRVNTSIQLSIAVVVNLKTLQLASGQQNPTLSQRQASHPANPSAAVATRITGAL